jgi:hypothetical protein
MTHRRLMLWLLLFIVGFNSTIGLPMHEAMHAEHGRAALAASTSSEMPLDVHSEFKDTDACASCYTYTHLSLAFIPSGLDTPSDKNAMFMGTVPGNERVFGIRYAYSSGCDPPAATA